MLKKIRRFIIKRTLEKELLTWLKLLNLLDENEIAELAIDDETEFYVSFNLRTNKNLFKKVYFRDTGKDKMTVDVILNNTIKNYETIIFSVTNFGGLHPKTYTIKPKCPNAYSGLQEINFDTEKISFSMQITEDNNPEGLAVVLLGLMEDIAIKLFKRNILNLTIHVEDFGEKIYWVDAILSEPIYKPESTVNLKQFDFLKYYF